MTTLAGELDGTDVRISGTADFGEALRQASAGEVDAIAIGAGLDDEVRLPFAERLRVAAPGVEVHVKPDRTGGPGAMIPFVRAVAVLCQ